MEIFSILTEQIALFVIYMLVGVLMVKTQVLNKTTLETISRFVIKLSMPVMIFINTVNGVDRATLFSSASVLGITVLLYVLLFLLTRLLAVLFRIRKDTVQLYQAVSMFGNVGFMGIPIVTSIFPEKGMLYISLFTIIDQLTLWTLGVKLTPVQMRWRHRSSPLRMSMAMLPPAPAASKSSPATISSVCPTADITAQRER